MWQPEDDLRQIKERSIRLAKNLGRKGLNRIADDWFDVRETFDRHEIAEFVASVEEKPGVGATEIKRFLGWADESSVAKAKSHGAISGEKYHRLIVEFPGDFRPSVAREGASAAWMWILSWVGRHDRAISKRRINRDVLEWLHYVAASKSLQHALADGNAADLDTELSAARSAVAEVLASAAIHSVTQLRISRGVDLVFHPRRPYKSKRIVAGKQVLGIRREWLPSYLLVCSIEKLQGVSHAAA